MSDSQIIVIGSGPAGVSAAWPLVEAGFNVLMIDAGHSASAPPSIDRPDLKSLRTGGGNSWRDLLKSDLSGLRDTSGTSPKLRCAADAAFTEDFNELNHLQADGYMALGALARGGLSNVWGAAVPAFDDTDLQGFPFKAADIQTSYQAIAERIGVSGDAGDSAVQGGEIPMQTSIPLSGVSKALHSRYLVNRVRLNLKIAKSRLAVLSQKIGDREACVQDGACMWGCSNGAVYNSAFDVAKLEGKPNFKIASGHLVESLERDSDGQYSINTRDRKTSEFTTFTTRTLFLAAGTFASTRLVLALENRFEEEVPLLTSPAIATAFLMPKMLARPLPDKMLGLSQLSFRTAINETAKDDAYGLLFDAAAMPAPDLLMHMQFTKLAGMKILRSLLPALSVALVYLPGEYGQCRAVLRRGGKTDTPQLHIKGGYTSDLGPVLDTLKKNLSRDFRRLGAFPLPGSTQFFQPGAANHHAGTLPMGRATSSFGEVDGLASLYVVDGSVLSRMPAKNLTFTVMANADRIGRHVVNKITE